jgi:hypothetical protein
MDRAMHRPNPCLSSRKVGFRSCSSVWGSSFPSLTPTPGPVADTQLTQQELPACRPVLEFHWVCLRPQQQRLISSTGLADHVLHA